jgi:uncharacterized protein
MVRYCIDNGLPFGIVLIRSGEEIGEVAEPYLVGTMVKILDIHEFEDGRFDLSVVGTYRFRIRDIDDAKPYQVAKVELVYEDEVIDDTDLRSTADEAREYCEALIRSQVDHPEVNINVIFPEEPDKLSFAVANMLELPLLRKQTLLETTDTGDRLQEILNLLQAESILNSLGPRRLRASDLRDFGSPN